MICCAFDLAEDMAAGLTEGPLKKKRRRREAILAAGVAAMM